MRHFLLTKMRVRSNIVTPLLLHSAFINSFFLALLIQSIGSEQLLVNTGIGFIFGLVISMVYLKNTLFGLMSKKSFWIAVGDHLIIFTILGMIHGLFM